MPVNSNITAQLDQFQNVLAKVLNKAPFSGFLETPQLLQGEDILDLQKFIKENTRGFSFFMFGDDENANPYLAYRADDEKVYLLSLENEDLPFSEENKKKIKRLAVRDFASNMAISQEQLAEIYRLFTVAITEGTEEQQSNDEFISAAFQGNVQNALGLSESAGITIAESDAPKSQPTPRDVKVSEGAVELKSEEAYSEIMNALSSDKVKNNVRFYQDAATIKVVLNRTTVTPDDKALLAAAALMNAINNPNVNPPFKINGDPDMVRWAAMLARAQHIEIDVKNSDPLVKEVFDIKEEEFYEVLNKQACQRNQEAIAAIQECLKKFHPENPTADDEEAAEDPSATAEAASPTRTSGILGKMRRGVASAASAVSGAASNAASGLRNFAMGDGDEDSEDEHENTTTAAAVAADPASSGEESGHTTPPRRGSVLRSPRDSEGAAADTHGDEIPAEAAAAAAAGDPPAGEAHRAPAMRPA